MSDPKNVTVSIIVSTDGWTARRVYSQYLSREIFTDPQGVEWIRVSAEAYDPAKGDIELSMKTRGLDNMRLRCRDSAAANLRKRETGPVDQADGAA